MRPEDIHNRISELEERIRALGGENAYLRKGLGMCLALTNRVNRKKSDMDFARVGHTARRDGR